MHILGVLGSHSIQTAELKQVIGALRPLPSGKLVRNIVVLSITHSPSPPSPLSPSQPTYYYSVQKALSVMSHDITQEGAVPLYYFDLRTRSSVSELSHTVIIISPATPLTVPLHPTASPLLLLHLPLLPHLGVSGLPPDRRPPHLQHSYQTGPRQAG